jgi:hypothetical protein
VVTIVTRVQVPTVIVSFWVKYEDTCTPVRIRSPKVQRINNASENCVHSSRICTFPILYWEINYCTETNDTFLLHIIRGEIKNKSAHWKRYFGKLIMKQLLTFQIIDFKLNNNTNLSLLPQNSILLIYSYISASFYFRCLIREENSKLIINS